MAKILPCLHLISYLFPISSPLIPTLGTKNSHVGNELFPRRELTVPIMVTMGNHKGNKEGQWMSLKELSALIKQHFKGYKEEPSSFQKIGNYLNRPEYKFQSKHATCGTLYWVKKRVS